MPWLAYGLATSIGAWIGSLSTTAASTPTNPIYQTSQDRSQDNINWTKVIGYGMLAATTVYIAKKVL